MARQLDGWGFRVVPVRPRDKRPALDRWQHYQTEPTTPKLASWFSGRGERYNYGIITGTASKVVVLDVDNDETLAWFRRQTGVAELLDSTTCVKTAKGWHFYFRIESGQVVDSTAQHEHIDGEVRIDWDLRGEGGHIVVPPSIHETGFRYEWIRGPEAMLEWSRWPGVSRETRSAERGQAAVVQIAGETQRRRSQLSKLLEAPPSAGGRNVWLSKVAGHLAKLVPHEDAYLQLVAMCNGACQPPLEEEEWRRTAASIWRSENEKDVEPSEGTGWLSEKDGILHSLCKVKSGDEFIEVWRPWSDFTLTAQGVIEADGSQQYVVDISTRRRTSRALLSKAELGDWRRLKVWLAGFGGTVLAPDQEHPKAAKGDPASRLHRWLIAQQPDHYRAVEWLGWHEGIGFVAHEGVILPGGLEDHRGVMPDPRLRERAPHRYGFVGEDEAKAVLSEVLTFHDPTVCSVFGAWWVACLLKPQIEKVASLFPFMALEAPSESGKTTGFFALMLALSGDVRGPGEYTLPVVRDRAGAHASGIVWLDDLSDTARVMDLLRQATGGGSRSKKGADRSSEETIKLVSPVVISGEGIAGITEEKALIHRAVRIEVPPVKGRVSARDPDRPQWDDILELRARYPDLTRVAGTLVQLCLQKAGRIADLPKLRAGGGRHADKLAILLTGATILAEITGDMEHLVRVEAWCDAQEDIGEENYLTTTILPRLLRDHMMPGSAWGEQPVFVDKDGVVWFSEQLVADAWSAHRYTGNRGQQLGSLESIRQQKQALGVTGKGIIKQVRERGKPGWQRRYQGLSTGVSTRVVERTGSILDLPNGQIRLDEDQV